MGNLPKGSLYWLRIINGGVSKILRIWFTYLRKFRGMRYKGVRGSWRRMALLEAVGV